MRAIFRKLGAKLDFKTHHMKLLNYSAIAIFSLAFLWIDNSFISPINIKNLLNDSAPLMIMAVGATFVLLIGSIDLSVGSVCSVANVLSMKFLLMFNNALGNIALATILAFGLTILFGIFAGALLGYVQTKWKIPSFIASLGFMSIWKSVALLITEVPITLSRSMWAAIDWYKMTVWLVGLPLILIAAITVLLFQVQNRTVFGKSVMAIGGNERTSWVSGIKVNRTKIIAFTINGACAAIGGILLAAKLKSGAPTIGDSFTLLVISSAVLGGTALSGGRGSVLGTMLGVFTVSIIRNGLNIIGVDVFWQNIVFGMIVTLSVILTTDRTPGRIAPK